MVGGFGQGGALALHSAFEFEEELAGIVALSAWMPTHPKFKVRT